MRKVEAEAARARCEAASPGPWMATEYCSPTGKWYIRPVGEWGSIPLTTAANAQLIAVARTGLPAALDMLERAMTSVKNLADSEVPADCTCDYCQDVTEARKLLREWEEQ